jgi:hypothetical protein
VARTPPDFAVPNAARVYDYLRGGCEAVPADRALAAALLDPEKGFPGLRVLVRQEKDFTEKAVQRLAGLSQVRQYIVAGGGFPLRPYVHEVARRAEPDAAAVYADADAMVASHARAVAGGEDWGEGIAVISADPADPGKVLADEGLLAVIDLGEPVAVILPGTLSAMDAESAREAVAGYMAALAPGSALAACCITFAGREPGDRMAAAFAPAGPWHSHPLQDVESFFAGLRIAHGHVMDLACWPYCPPERKQPGARVLGGIGILG